MDEGSPGKREGGHGVIETKHRETSHDYPTTESFISFLRLYPRSVLSLIVHLSRPVPCERVPPETTE